MHDRARLRLTWTQVRALLSVGVLLGIGAVGTLGAFTASASVSPGSFTTGTLDVRLAAATNNVGQGGTWSDASLALSAMAPGESVAGSFPVRNDGSVPFTYTAAATASGSLAPALRFTTYVGGTATNTGTAAAGNRAGTCTGTALSSSKTLSATSTTVIGTAQQIAAGANQSVCVVVSLPSGTASSFQGTTATASFAFNAVQLS